MYEGDALTARIFLCKIQVMVNDQNVGHVAAGDDFNYCTRSIIKLMWADGF